MRASISVLLVMVGGLCMAQPISPTNRDEAKAALIPYPQVAHWIEGRPTEITRVQIVADSADLRDQAAWVLKEAGVRVDSSARTKLTLKTAQVKGATLQDSAYDIRVSRQQITINAATVKGHFYGLQTLRQLAKTSDGGVPQCRIVDWPEFPIRGFMHDVGRNPQDVETLKKFIDVMAQYKLSVFHIHLTDHPGWRVESKAYPVLNSPESHRDTRRPGFFYTYDQLRELIAFAKERHIQILPEIDMPGHSEYFDKAFGFGMQDPRGIEVLKTCLKEFFQEIPAEDVPLFHMGSDEVRLTNPKFMAEISSLIRSCGRELMVWHPGHDPEGEFIHALWSSVAINPNVPHVDGRQIYVNHMAPLLGPTRAWAKQYCEVRRVNKRALGGMLCHWPDNNVGRESNIYKQSPVYPAILAFSERIWRGSNRHRPELYALIPATDDPDREEWMMFERDMVSHRDQILSSFPFDYIRHSHIPWVTLGPFKEGEEPADPLGEPGWSEPVFGGTISIRHKFGFESAASAQTGVVFAKTTLLSDRDQDLTFWIGFDDYSRSGGRRGGPSPTQGQWSRHDQKIYVNGQRIDPPAWAQPGVGVQSKEIPFVDELYWIRRPTTISVKKGANQILIKNIHKDSGFGWTFTFLPVDLRSGRPREFKNIDWRISGQAND